MRLEARDGEVAWVRADGTVSEKPVSGKAAVEFCGFPVPSGPGGGRCQSLHLISGEPAKDEIILVQASGHTWFGPFLLSRASGEAEKIWKEDLEYAESLVDNPPGGRHSLAKMLEAERQRRRRSVDVEALASRKGLRVREALGFEGYWSRDVGEFYDLPEGWDMMPVGDAALTHQVRKGPHWVILRKEGKYTETVGTAAPADAIHQAFQELGGEEGALRRQKGKQKGQQRREEQLTTRLREAIRRVFPGIPDEDLGEVVAKSREPGAVGSAQFVYFPTRGESEEAFDRAAYLAVRAHVRHKYTHYDEILMEIGPETSPEELRSDARRAVSGDIEGILDRWRQPQAP